MESAFGPSETSLIRQTALDLLEEAYQTDPSQTLSRERANRLEALIARHLAGSTEAMNKIRSGPLLGRYLELVIESALHLSEVTWTGFCSGRSNRLLRGDQLPLDLPGWRQEQFFPELELNLRLSKEERSTCLERVGREREALSRAFKSALARGDFEPQFFGIEGLEFNYYEQVCIEERCPSVKRPPQNELFVDLGPKGVQVFTISTRLLLESALDGVNPFTGRPYLNETLQRIRSRFQIELKLLEEERSA